MKTALVLEGGAMRGIYSAGVLDIFIENQIKFDAVIGVSAGALFGANYLSEQAGRVLRYCKRFNPDRNYMGIRPLLKEGNIVSTEYAYHLVPEKLDVFDDEKFRQSEIPFTAVVTDIESGKPEYIRIRSVFDQMDILRASGSMPFVSKPVCVDGKKYLDGAVTDSIPYEYMLARGYDHIVAVLTKPEGYVKKPVSPLMADLCYRWRYPELSYRIRKRHEMYNAQMKKLEELAADGTAEIIRRKQEISISKLERNPEKLQLLYDAGRSDAAAWLKEKNEGAYRHHS